MNYWLSHNETKQGLNTSITKLLDKKVKHKFSILPLQDFPPLKQEGLKGRPQAKIDNTHYEYFSSRLQGIESRSLSKINSEYESILIGVSRLNWYKPEGKQKSLSYKLLLKVLASLETITNERIQLLLQVEYRQANRYFKALQLAIPYMNKIQVV